MGVLGCPNLPQKRIEHADGAAESASKTATDGVGVIFTAERGQGAFAGPLSGEPWPLMWHSEGHNALLESCTMLCLRTSSAECSAAFGCSFLVYETL